MSLWAVTKKDFADIIAEEKAGAARILRFAGSLLGAILVISALFGSLWLLVAVVKWMWQHS